MGIGEGRDLGSCFGAVVVAGLTLGSLTVGSANAATSQGSASQVLTSLIRLLPPTDRSNVVYIDSQCGSAANPARLVDEVWQAPPANDHCYLHHTGEKFTLRKVAGRPGAPLRFAPARGTSIVEILREFQLRFGARSGPYRRVLSRLPTPTKPGYAWMSTSIYLPGAIDIAELDDDTSCVYCGGWGGRGGAVDAGFVHSRARHDWALFVRREIPVKNNSQRTGETFSFKNRFKEDQVVKLTLSVPANDKVAITVTGLDDRGAPLKRTAVIEMDHQFEWRADGKANILKRITTIAQNHENFEKNEKVVGVRWFSPTADHGPCLIGLSWRSNHEWASSDTAQNEQLASFETWPASFGGLKIVFVDLIGPGEETDGIILAGAQRPATSRSH